MTLPENETVSESTPKVRLAVIGVGVMGSSHVKDIATRLPNTQLAAVCDIIPERADQYASQYQVPAFYDYRDMLDKVALDGIVIATPHYDHTPISIDALQRGIHVLVEKPLAVHVKDGRKMIAAYEQARLKKPDIQFAIMFMSRLHSQWKKIKEILDAGELGKLVRATWLITDWFRTQTYYDNGGWRATWSGEGGGVLLNQCPHNLDLYQWFFGLPKRVAGFAHIGKYHNIEVEDEVTGYFEHENGMVGHFVTTTAESPGTNRLEIVGENGKLVYRARDSLPSTATRPPCSSSFAPRPIHSILFPARRRCSYSILCRLGPCHGDRNLCQRYLTRRPAGGLCSRRAQLADVGQRDDAVFLPGTSGGSAD